MFLFSSTTSSSKPPKSLVHNSRKSSRRGVSEIIAAIILLGVTVAGGLIVFVVVQNSDQLTFVTAERESLNPNVIPQLKISGYDTRDTDDLYSITAIDNQTGVDAGDPDFLCATSCTDGGLADNEFIILRVRNDADIIVSINSISINEVEHVFDSDHTTQGQLFSGSTTPEDGEFIIISGFGTSGLLQEYSSHLPAGSEKRFVIRLANGDSGPPATGLADIALNSNIRVIINSSVETTQLFLVPAGSLI